MGWQDAPLATQQTPKAPGWQSAPMAEEPDLAGANKSLARTVGDAMKPSLQTVEDVGSVYAPIETALNASTGLLFGFPAYIGGAIGGLADKYLLGEDVDPKQMAETISKVFTYIPQTERGKRLTGNVMQPLDWLQQGAQYAGEKVSGALAKTELPTNVAAGAGAVTDSTIQMLPALLLSALGRRMGGNIPASEDFSNTAKVIAGKDAAPATVAAAESSLRSTYAETGIDPFTVAEAAAKEPALAAEVLSPEGATPKSIMALTQEAKGLSAETEAGGTPPAAAAPSGQPRGPLLDVSGETMDEARAAAPAASALEQRIADPGIRAELQNMRGETGWAEVGGRLVRSEGREGEVTGRTSWIPNADWWPGRPKGLTEIQTRAAIDKALAGEPLNAKETRFVDYATQIADENIRSSAHAPTADELSSADLGPKDALDVSMVARASELDEGAVERLSVAHEGDDAAFMRGIKEMLDANDQNAKTAIGGQAGIAEAQPAAAGAAAGRSASPAAATGAREATGIVELGAGVSPAAAARAYAETYTPFVGVEAPEKFKQPGGIMDSFQKVMAPAARGPIAEQQAGIMRANFGEMAHEREVALEKLRDFAADFDKAPVEENYKFIDAMEHGTKLGDPKLQAAADGIRALLDQKREQVQALGKGQLENFVQNYFPHIWQDEGAAQAFYARRPLTG